MELIATHSSSTYGRQCRVSSNQFSKLIVAFVSFEAGHFPPKQTAKNERQVWRNL
jgi:hypothetical protein